jgi:hypothetical protein
MTIIKWYKHNPVTKPAEADQRIKSLQDEYITTDRTIIRKNILTQNFGLEK